MEPGTAQGLGQIEGAVQRAVDALGGNLRPQYGHVGGKHAGEHLGVEAAGVHFGGHGPVGGLVQGEHVV